VDEALLNTLQIKEFKMTFRYSVLSIVSTYETCYKENFILGNTFLPVENNIKAGNLLP
jgi:hypothetical protein